MNKIPKCNNNKKILPLKISKKTNKESLCGKMKMKLLTNQSIIKTFGRDITNISKNKETIKIPKKSSSCNNEKVSNKKYKIICINFYRKIKKLK